MLNTTMKTIMKTMLNTIMKNIKQTILKTTITVQDQVLEVYSTELFETENRVFMLSIFNIFSAVPVFLSPLINDLLNHHSFIFTYFWFGVIGLALFLLGLFFKNETYRTTLK